MSDDATRSGGGSLGGLGSDKTQLQARKIQIRMPSGKIYGPYQRLEILSFIAAGKIKGDEYILVEGTSDWKIITTDAEFFDSIQQAIFGTSVGGQKPAATPSKTIPSGPKESMEAQLPKTSVPTPAAPTPPARSKTYKPMELEIDVSVPPLVTPQEFTADKKVTGFGAVPVAAGPKLFGKTLPRWQVITLAAGALALLFYFVTDDRGPPMDPQQKAKQLFAMKAPSNYFKPLASALGDLKVAIPAMPDKFANSPEWTITEGFNALDWIHDIQLLADNAQPDQRASAAYWGRWAWDLQWLGRVVAVADENQGKHLRQEGESIYKALQKQKLVPADIEAMFAIIESFDEGRWDEVIAKLGAVKTQEAALILSEEASWWGFWEKGASGAKPLAFKEGGYSSSVFDASSKLRTAFLNRDQDTADVVDEFIGENPWTILPWFASAELYWRILPGQVQRSNVRFISGLGVLSLAPKSVQLVYWKQYADFLSTFGRQATADRALANFEALQKNNLKSWWDLGDEGLELSRLSSEILSRSQGSPMSAPDLASLQVMGPLIPKGSEALVAAGQLMSFESEWKKARGLYQTAQQIEPDSVSAIGGSIWATASLFKFDKAFEYYDLLVKAPNADFEAQKYNALIHFIGREREDGLRDMFQYTKSVPNDAWGHYFLATMYDQLEKSVECAKAAQLATIHGTGELKFRANLLRLHCMVMAKIGVRDAIAELKAIQVKNPRSIPAILALTSAQMNMDLLDDALHLTEDSLRKMPRAYQLRVRIGEIYEKKRDYDKAVAFYLSASKEKKEAVEPRLKVAHVYELQERPLDAAANFKTAALLNPEYPEIWILTARAYVAAGLRKEAADYYMKEIEERPAVLSSFLEFAEFMLKINAPQEVPKIFQKFKANYQDDPRVLTRLAQAYLALKEFESARNAASAAMSKDPNLAEPYRVLAICSEQQSVYSTSKEFYQKYLVRFPQAPDASEIRMKLSKPPFTQ